MHVERLVVAGTGSCTMFVVPVRAIKVKVAVWMLVQIKEKWCCRCIFCTVLQNVYVGYEDLAWVNDSRGRMQYPQVRFPGKSYEQRSASTLPLSLPLPQPFMEMSGTAANLPFHPTNAMRFWEFVHTHAHSPSPSSLTAPIVSFSSSSSSSSSSATPPDKDYRSHCNHNYNCDNNYTYHNHQTNNNASSQYNVHNTYYLVAAPATTSTTTPPTPTTPTAAAPNFIGVHMEEKEINLDISEKEEGLRVFVCLFYLVEEAVRYELLLPPLIR